jgi:hypothetical protein
MDAAVVDAYERRVAGQADAGLDAELQAEIAAAELQAYVTLHQRVAGLPRAEVASSVRAVVLSAAAQGADEHVARRRQESPLVRLLIGLMRPGPLMALAAVVAVFVGLSVRMETAPATTAEPEIHGDNAVAMAEAPTLKPALEPAAPAPAAPTAVPPTGGSMAAPAAAVPEAEAQAAPSAPALPRPVRTIEAQAASLGPAAAESEGLGARLGVLGAAADDAAPAMAKREQHAEKAKLPSAKPYAEGNLDAALAGRGVTNEREAPVQKPMAQAPEETQQNAAQAYHASANAAPAAAPQYRPANQEAATREENRRNDATNQKDEANYQSAGTRNQVAEKAAAQQAADRPADDKQPLSKKASDKESASRDSANTAAPNAVAHWRQTAEDAQTPEERIAALKQLVVAAQAAGDEKAAKSAQQALKAAQAEMVARKRVQGLQDTPPAQRAKAAPSQGSGELKAQKK